MQCNKERLLLYIIMKVTLQNTGVLFNFQTRFSHDQVIPKHSLGGREQHR